MNFSISPENKQNINMLQERIAYLSSWNFMLDYREIIDSSPGPDTP
jgi:hypothetical protein